MAGVDLPMIRERGHFYLPEVAVYIGRDVATLRNWKSAQVAPMAHAWTGQGRRVCVPVEDVEAYIEEERSMRGRV